MDTDEAYDVLGLSPPVSDDEIKRTYRKLTKEYHPDLTGGETRQQWMEIDEAKDILLAADRQTTATTDTTGASTQDHSSDTTATGTTAGGSGRERTYTREQRNRRRRRRNQHNTGADSHSTDDTTVEDVAFSAVGRTSIGERIQISGVITAIEVSSSGAGIECTIVSPKQPTDEVTVYISKGVGNRSVLARWEEFKLTGVLRRDEGEGEWQLYVDDSDEITRVNPGWTFDDVREAVKPEDSPRGDRTNRRQTTETSSTNRGTLNSIWAGTKTTGFYLLFLPGALANNMIPWYVQLGALFVTAVLSVQYTPFALLFFVLLFYLTFAGLVITGLVGISFVLQGEWVNALGFALVFTILCVYYWFTSFEDGL